VNTKLHAVTDANGRPLSFFMTAGQTSDYTGAAALLDDLPKAICLLGGRRFMPTAPGRSYDAVARRLLVHRLVCTFARVVVRGGI